MSDLGYIHFKLIKHPSPLRRGTTAEDFKSFIVDLAEKMQKNGVIVMDNAAIHHSTSLRSTWAMIQAAYGIQRLYLPAYSPFLNPIEQSFHHIKSAIAERQFSSTDQLCDAVSSHIRENISPHLCESWCSHSRKYYGQCLRSIAFNGNILAPEICSLLHPSELPQQEAVRGNRISPSDHTDENDEDAPSSSTSRHGAS